MIFYRSEGFHTVSNIFRFTGSVYPVASLAALPCAVLTALMRVFLTVVAREHGDPYMLHEAAIWAGFNSLLGFLIVFRTSQGYARFWAGCTALHRVQSEWYDACAALVAFCKYSRGEPNNVNAFRTLVVRLFSILFTCALAHVEDQKSVTRSEENARAFSYELIGGDIDDASMTLIKESHSKVELVYQWIQHVVVENISRTVDDGRVLDIPPPILSRAFQNMTNGMSAYNEAVQVSSIPFPFPYAQCCSCLLTIHWLLVPWVVCSWTDSWWVAAVFSFLQVFILWALNAIAIEIENPFGTDPNDLDGRFFQTQMNAHLEVLLARGSQSSPTLVAPDVGEDCPRKRHRRKHTTMRDLMSDAGEASQASSRSGPAHMRGGASVNLSVDGDSISGDTSRSGSYVRSALSRVGRSITSNFVAPADGHAVDVEARRHEDLPASQDQSISSTANGGAGAGPAAFTYGLGPRSANAGGRLSRAAPKGDTLGVPSKNRIVSNCPSSNIEEGDNRVSANISRTSHLDLSTSRSSSVERQSVNSSSIGHRPMVPAPLRVEAAAQMGDASPCILASPVSGTSPVSGASRASAQGGRDQFFHAAHFGEPLSNQPLAEEATMCEPGGLASSDPNAESDAPELMAI